MTQVKRAVVLLAGYGTRCLPFTKVLPKAMLPILNKPIIAYIVEELEKSDLEEVIFVLAKACNGKVIKQYFSPNKSYEKYLKKRKKIKELNELQNIKTNLKIKYVFNTKANGGGGALLSAKKYLKKEPFIVLNGDDVFFGKENPINKMLDIYKKTQKNVILLQKVEKEKRSLYGICQVEKRKNFLKVTNLVEKPKQNEVKGNHAIVGRYLLNYDIFKILKKEKKQKDEINLTEGLLHYIRQNKLVAIEIDAKRVDGGNLLELAKANILFGLNEEIVEK